jgi:hypothetical protein
MSYLRAGGDGVVNIPALNASGQLYIRGKKFEDYINELVFEDSFEQAEITELKLLLQYLNTTGLSSEWIVDNNTKNQDLKTLITALQTKLAQIDTTALTLPSVLTNDNRNSVLKTAIDSVDGKTRYVSSVQGSNTEPKVASDFQVSIADRDKRRIYMTTGANQISCINDSTTQATQGENTDNQILISAPNGMVETYGYLNCLRGANTIEITGYGGMGVQTSPNIKIGNKGAQILIGSEDTPELNQTNTVIKIGKRTITKNTETQLRGNMLIADARFTELSTSPALTWTNFLALISTSGMPSYIASLILTSAIPNFSYSDLWAMKGIATKDGDVETTTTPRMKGYTIFDSSIGIDITPKVQTFLAKGDISETTLLGSIRQQTFNGEILLRNNNILATNINWALTDAMDKVNALKLSNNDVELIAGAGADNSQLRISNTCTNGKMKFRMGSGGLQANAHDALAIYNDQASSQVLIAGSNVPSGYDTSSKLLVDHQSMTHGIKVSKASEALITRVNHNNINTPSLTLQSNWTGTTANSLYLNASNQLMYNGSAVGSGAGGGGTGAGAIFILNNPSNLTNTLVGTTMTTTFTSVSATFIRREAFVANTVYGMGQFKSPYIDYSSNVILQGTYEANLYGLLLSYQVSSIFCKLYHVAERAVITDYLVDKTALYSTNNNTGLYFSMKSKVFVLPANECNFTINSVVITQLTVAAGMGGGEPLTLRLSLKNDLGSTIGNAVDINFGGGPTITQDYTFNFNQILNISGTTIVAFQIDIIDSMFGMAQIRQITSRAQNDINYKFQGVFKNCLYNGTNDKTTLAYNQMQLYSILLPLPSNSYDTSEFTVYSKLQLEPFFIQTGTGSTSGNSFTLYCGDNTLSHFHTSINLGGGATSIPTLAQIMNNDIVALGAPHFVNATRATQHLDMNSKTIYNVASINGYTVRSITAGNSISITEPSTGNYTINYVPTTTIAWNNDIRFTNANPVIQMNPTLTTQLDLNQFVYEIQIETYLTGHAAYLSISFNEIFTGLVFGGTGNRHVFSSQHSRFTNPDTQVIAGEIYRDSNASWYTENLGDFTVWGYLRPLRSVRYGANGTNNQNLGVLFHGQSWYNRKNMASNTSLTDACGHHNFHKIIYALPLINRETNPNGLLNNINYISVNSSGNPVIQNLRIRTRIHSTIDRN